MEWNVEKALQFAEDYPSYPVLWKSLQINYRQRIEMRCCPKTGGKVHDGP